MVGESQHLKKVFHTMRAWVSRLARPLASLPPRYPNYLDDLNNPDDLSKSDDELRIFWQSPVMVCQLRHQ